MVVGALCAAFVGILRGTSQVSQSLTKSSDARFAAAYVVSDASNSSGPEVSLTDTTSCADPNPPVSGTPAPVVRFDSIITNSTGATQPDVVMYTLVSNTGLAPFSFVRRQCRNGALINDDVLANSVASVNVTCLPTASPKCSGTPTSITVVIVETADSNGAIYQFSLSGTFQKLIGSGAPPPPASVILLGTGGTCVGSPVATGISLAGGANLTVYGTAFINSPDVAGCTAMSMNNGGVFTHIGTTSFLNTATCSGSGCPTRSPYSPALSDPYRNLVPPSTAGMTNVSASGCSGTLQPGFYTSGLSITTGPCTLASGIYVVQGGLNVSNGASLTSAAGGVLIYIKTGTFSVGGGSPVTLSALSSNSYGGLVLWQATPNSTITFNNGGQIVLNGTLYAPSAQLNIQGGSSTPVATSIVVQSIVMANAGKLTIGAPLAIVSPASLAAAPVNQPYSQTTVGGTGGGGDYAWSATGLPAGMAIDADTGVIAGTPTAAGTFSVVVTLNDSAGDSPDTQGYSLTINPPPTVTRTDSFARPQGTTNQNVTIFGSSFVSGAGAAFSGTGITVNSTTFVSSSALTANVTIAAGAPTGLRNVTVINPDAGVGTGIGVFTVNPSPSVTGASPTPRGQGAVSQNVTIAGSAFANGAAAGFSGTGITVNSTTFVSSSTLTANVTIAAGTATGVRNVTVINPDTGVGVGTGVFSVSASSTVTSASPTSRPQGATARSETIGGAGFVSGAVASFSGSGITVNSTTFVNSTTLTANVTIDAGAATGVGDVMVTNPDAGVGVATGAFTVNAAPNVQSVSPASRPQGATSQNITISGTGFASGAGAAFSGSGITVSSTTFVNSTTLTANITITAGAATGARDVTVINTDTGVDVQLGAFTVNALPTVSSTSPVSRGQGAAGQNVTITGTGFASGAGAAFSGTGITVNSTTFVDSTTLTANITIAGGATTGLHNVTVVNADAGVGVGTNVFTVNAAPTVTSTSPSSRGQGGTPQNVTVTGTGFVSGAVASFSGSGIAVNSTTFVSATSLTANVTVVVGATIGARDVTVTNPDAGFGTGTGKFAVVVGPTVTSTSPTSRPQGATSQSVTITGAGFVTGAVASFSGTGITVSSTAFVNTTTLTATVTITAGAPVGVRDVTVTNLDSGAGTGTGKFTVNPAPTVTAVSPTSRGQGATSQTITITGTGFVAGAVASFSGAGITVNSTTFVSSTSLTANITVIAGAATGVRNVTIVNADTGVGVATNVFTVDIAPTIGTISPTSQAHSSSGVVVTINGTGFVSGATVSFGGSNLPTITNTSFVTSIKMTVTLTAPSTANTWSITVTNPDGGTVTKATAYSST